MNHVTTRQVRLPEIKYLRTQGWLDMMTGKEKMLGATLHLFIYLSITFAPPSILSVLSIERAIS